MNGIRNNNVDISSIENVFLSTIIKQQDKTEIMSSVLDKQIKN